MRATFQLFVYSENLLMFCLKKRTQDWQIKKMIYDHPPPDGRVASSLWKDAELRFQFEHADHSVNVFITRESSLWQVANFKTLDFAASLVKSRSWIFHFVWTRA